MYKPFRHLNSQIAACPVSSGPTPGPFPTPDMWLDASQLSGGEGDNITSWPDEAGNGYDYSATSTGPKLSLTGLNGHPALEFNGTSSGLLSRSLAGNFQSICIVYNRRGTGGSLYRNNSSSSYRNEFSFVSSWFGYTGFAHRGFSGTSAGYLYSKSDMPTNTNLTMVAITDGTFSGSNASRVYINNNLISTSAVDGFGINTSKSEIGGYDLSASSSRYFDGYIAEIIGYQRILSDADRDAVSDYLDNKYDINQPSNEWDISLFSATPSETGMTGISNAPRAVMVTDNNVNQLSSIPGDCVVSI